MATTDQSLLTAGVTAFIGDATSRKRKQGRSVEENESVSPWRKNRLRYQYSGLCSSILTTLADAHQQSAASQRLCLVEDTCGAYESTDNRLGDSSNPDVHSVPQSDVCQYPAGQEQRQAEGRMYDQFKPFVSVKPGQEDGVPEGEGYPPNAAAEGYPTLWRRPRQWKKLPRQHVMEADPGNSASVNGSGGGSRTGSGASKQVCWLGEASLDPGSSASGVTKDSLTVKERGGETGQRPPCLWNNPPLPGSGSLSGVTKETRFRDQRTRYGGESMENRSQDVVDSPEYDSPECTVDGLLQEGRLSSWIPSAAREGKRGRREFEEEEEREWKSHRVETIMIGPRKGMTPFPGGSDSPDSVLTGGRGLLESPRGDEKGEVSQLLPSSVTGELLTTATELTPQEGSGIVKGTPVQAAAAGPDVSESAGGGLRAGEQFLTCKRDSQNDSQALSADVDSACRLSGYDPDSSLSDAPVGDGTVFVLSSGRSRRRQGGPVPAKRQPTIDDEFEQYFSQMLL